MFYTQTRTGLVTNLEKWYKKDSLLDAADTTFSDSPYKTRQLLFHLYTHRKEWVSV